MTVYAGNYRSRHYYTLISATCDLCSSEGPEISTTDGDFSSKSKDAAREAAVATGWLQVTVPFCSSSKTVVLCSTCCDKIQEAVKSQGRS